MESGEILDKAKEIVTKNRQTLYGPAERNFVRIASLWENYLQVSVQPHEVAICLALVKIARMDSAPEHLDNYIDLAGYAALAGELADHLDVGVTKNSDEVTTGPTIPHGLTAHTHSLHS